MNGEIETVQCTVYIVATIRILIYTLDNFRQFRQQTEPENFLPTVKDQTGEKK